MASWNSACTLARSPRLSLVGIFAAIKGKREEHAAGLRCHFRCHYVHNFVRGGKVARSFAPPFQLGNTAKMMHIIPTFVEVTHSGGRW